ncbi:MAG: DUF4258 domain-containing protein [Peptococcaceae bacterium]|nr:DUF4258 domain-containing protein [Peptococcaceae bacterium]
MIDIAALRSLVSAGYILWTEHLALRLRERGIKRADVIACVQSGETIEQYPDDMPFPSCLILGAAMDGKPLHVVCAYNPDVNCCMITAYYPNQDKWESDNRTRKAGE